MSVFGFISGLLEPAVRLIDGLHTSDEEKARAKAKLLEIQHTFASKVLDYEQRLMEARASVIASEAQSASSLTRMWRPITMLTFVGLIVWRWVGPVFGAPDPGIPQALELELFSIVKIGLGGYVVGRSGEKIVKTWQAGQGEQA